MALFCWFVWITRLRSLWVRFAIYYILYMLCGSVPVQYLLKGYEILEKNVWFSDCFSAKSCFFFFLQNFNLLRIMNNSVDIRLLLSVGPFGKISYVEIDLSFQNQIFRFGLINEYGFFWKAQINMERSVVFIIFYGPFFSVVFLTSNQRSGINFKIFP